MIGDNLIIEVSRYYEYTRRMGENKVRLRWITKGTKKKKISESTIDMLLDPVLVYKWPCRDHFNAIVADG